MYNEVHCSSSTHTLYVIRKSLLSVFHANSSFAIPRNASPVVKIRMTKMIATSTAIRVMATENSEKQQAAFPYVAAVS